MEISLKLFLKLGLWHRFPFVQIFFGSSAAALQAGAHYSPNLIVREIVRERSVKAVISLGGAPAR
jgi:hypothetical protein